MTARRPTGALVDKRGVIFATDQDAAAGLGLLEVTFQTQVGIPFREQLGVDAAMRRMASGAAFAGRLMLKDERPLLRLMALQTVIVLGKQMRAAGDKRGALMRRMALDASQITFGHGMVIGQIKLAAHVQVAFVTNRLNGPRRRQRQPRARSRRLGTTGRKAVRRLGLAAGI